MRGKKINRESGSSGERNLNSQIKFNVKGWNNLERLTKEGESPVQQIEILMNLIPNF